MTDYHSPTVVQPTIPNADMTPLEQLLLTRIFEAEPDGNGLYFFAEIAHPTPSSLPSRVFTPPSGNPRASPVLQTTIS
jgi:hypothetical protein